MPEGMLLSKRNAVGKKTKRDPVKEMIARQYLFEEKYVQLEKMKAYKIIFFTSIITSLIIFFLEIGIILTREYNVPDSFQILPFIMGSLYMGLVFWLWADTMFAREGVSPIRRAFILLGLSYFASFLFILLGFLGDLVIAKPEQLSIALYAFILLGVLISGISFLMGIPFVVHLRIRYYQDEKFFE